MTDKYFAAIIIDSIFQDKTIMDYFISCRITVIKVTDVIAVYTTVFVMIMRYN